MILTQEDKFEIGVNLLGNKTEEECRAEYYQFEIGVNLLGNKTSKIV